MKFSQRKEGMYGENDLAALDDMATAAMYFLDLRDMIDEIGRAWSQYRDGEASLPLAAAITGLCVSRADALDAEVLLGRPHLEGAENLMLALFVVLREQPSVRWIMEEYAVTYPVALKALAMVYFPGETQRLQDKCIRDLQTLPGLRGKRVEMILYRRLAQQYWDRLDGEDDTVGWNFSKFSTGRFEIRSTMNVVSSMRDLDLAGAQRLQPKAGFFGPDYSESALAQKADAGVADLRSLLMGDVIPAFVAPEHHGEFQMLPKGADRSVDKAGIKMMAKCHKNCNTFIAALRQFRTATNIPTSTILAVHSLSISVLLTQGHASRGVGGTAEHVKDSLRIMMGHAAQMHKDKFPYQEQPQAELATYALNWIYNRNGLACTTKEQLARTLYNPLLGGETLLTAGTAVNLLHGIAFGSGIDNISQLRITLHVYNALQLTGNLAPKSIPLLDELDAAFGQSGSLWKGGRPTATGSCMSALALAWGNSPGQVKTLRNTFVGGMPDPSTNAPAWRKAQKAMKTLAPGEGRDLKNFEMSEVSPVFRLAVEHDYSNIPNYDGSICASVAHLREAFRKDTIYGVSLAGISRVLANFVFKLTEALGVNHLIDDMVKKYVPPNRTYRDSRENMRVTWCVYFAECFLCQYVDTDEGPNRDAILERVAAAMKSHFNDGMDGADWKYLTDVVPERPDRSLGSQRQEALDRHRKDWPVLENDKMFITLAENVLESVPVSTKAATHDTGAVPAGSSKPKNKKSKHKREKQKKAQKNMNPDDRIMKTNVNGQDVFVNMDRSDPDLDRLVAQHTEGMPPQTGEVDDVEGMYGCDIFEAVRLRCRHPDQDSSTADLREAICALDSSSVITDGRGRFLGFDFSKPLMSLKDFEPVLFGEYGRGSSLAQMKRWLQEDHPTVATVSPAALQSLDALFCKNADRMNSDPLLDLASNVNFRNTYVQCPRPGSSEVTSSRTAYAPPSPRQPDEPLKMCSGCKALPPPGQALMACAQCHKAFYCSRGCQRADWKRGHKLKCKPKQ